MYLNRKTYLKLARHATNHVDLKALPLADRYELGSSINTLKVIAAQLASNTVIFLDTSTHERAAYTTVCALRALVVKTFF